MAGNQQVATELSLPDNVELVAVFIGRRIGNINCINHHQLSIDKSCHCEPGKELEIGIKQLQGCFTIPVNALYRACIEKPIAYNLGYYKADSFVYPVESSR